MKTCIFALSFFLFLSCKKETIVSPAFSEARYNIEITGQWKSPEFGVPPSVHFTTVLGLVHNNQFVMWKEGSMASPGVEAIAEVGAQYPFLNEVNDAITVGTGIANITIAAPQPTGSSRTNIYCNSSYSYISFETMLAPTPDWFTGVGSLNLYAGNKWVVDTTINLYAFDAGTEDGDTFAMNNPETMPRGNVQKLTTAQAAVLANGNPVLAPIATVRFRKQ